MYAPTVSVLMSVYNGEKYLKAAINSILNQTFKDFEFIIINDGSKDNSVNILNSYKDKRIKLIHNETNMGLPKSLNIGLNLSTGRYLARMDSDDISFPQRLESQVTYMNNNPDISLCGTWIKCVNELNNCISIQKYPVRHEEIKSMMFWKVGVSHPSVMFKRKDFLDNNLYYDESFICSQDYELWVRALQYIKFSNIPKVLLARRCGNHQLGSKLQSIQQKNACIVRERQLYAIGINPTEEEKKIHALIMMPKDLHTTLQLSKIGRWLMQIKGANWQHKIYCEPYFSNQLSELWFECCYCGAANGNWAWRLLLESPLYDKKVIKLRSLAKFIVKFLEKSKV